MSESQLRKDSLEERQRVLSEARSWVGTPYHHHARVKGGGVDCAMLLAEVFSRAGLVQPIAVEQYSEQWHLHKNVEKFLAELMKHCRAVEFPAPADIALFKLGRVYSHGAIIVEWPNQIIHANMSSGIVELCEVVGNPHLERCETLFFSPWE